MLLGLLGLSYGPKDSFQIEAWLRASAKMLQAAGAAPEVAFADLQLLQNESQARELAGGVMRLQVGM